MMMVQIIMNIYIFNRNWKYAVEEESDPLIGPVIVAYRLKVKSNRQLFPLTEDDEYPIYVNVIIEMIVNHSVYVSNNKNFNS